MLFSPGQDANSPYFMPLLEQISLPGSQGRLRKHCQYALSDKGYDSQLLRQMHRKLRPGLPRLLDKSLYRKLNAIEWLFSWLKEKRRLCTYYDKLASNFRAMVVLACHRKMPAR